MVHVVLATSSCLPLPPRTFANGQADPSAGTGNGLLRGSKIHGLVAYGFS